MRTDQKKRETWHYQKEQSPIRLPVFIPALQRAHSFSYTLYSKQCEEDRSVRVRV